LTAEWLSCSNSPESIP